MEMFRKKAAAKLEMRRSTAISRYGAMRVSPFLRALNGREGLNWTANNRAPDRPLAWPVRSPCVPPFCRSVSMVAMSDQQVLAARAQVMAHYSVLHCLPLSCSIPGLFSSSLSRSASRSASLEEVKASVAQWCNIGCRLLGFARHSSLP